MLIDVHVHLLPPRRMAGLLRWMHRYYPQHPVPIDVTLDECLADYAALGADYIFNLVYPIEAAETRPLLAFNLELHARHPWIIPWGSLHPDDPDKERIVDEAIAGGCFGFKFHPFIQRFDPADPRMLPAYQALQRHRRPVVFHTGFEEFYGLSLPVSTMEQIVRSFPQLPVVFAHSLFPEFAEAFRIVERYDSVRIEMTNVFGALYDDRYLAAGHERAGKTLHDGLLHLSERIMFGSDHPAGLGTLAEVYRGLDRLGLPETVKENLLGLTARRFADEIAPGLLARTPPRGGAPATA